MTFHSILAESLSNKHSKSLYRKKIILKHLKKRHWLPSSFIVASTITFRTTGSWWFLRDLITIATFNFSHLSVPEICILVQILPSQHNAEECCHQMQLYRDLHHKLPVHGLLQSDHSEQLCVRHGNFRYPHHQNQLQLPKSPWHNPHFQLHKRHAMLTGQKSKITKLSWVFPRWHDKKKITNEQGNVYWKYNDC